jgi:hypothetical protein
MGVPGHPTKTVTHPLDGPVEIDVRLAPLIRQLWRRGIETSQSCQEYNPGLACIEFPGTAEVMVRPARLPKKRGRPPKGEGEK